MDPSSSSALSVDGELAELVARLAEMGFTESKAMEALKACAGNVNAAASYLISTAVLAAPFAPGPPEVSPSSPSATDPVLIQGPISQYSIENGRSACTCIALTAAHKFLAKPDVPCLTPVFLQDAVITGVTNYLQILQASMIPSDTLGGASTAPQGDHAVEHYSAEQVMATNTGTVADPTRVFSCLHQLGPVRQGVLNKDVTHPMGLPSMLHDCWASAAPEDDDSTPNGGDDTLWTAVIVTKTPETLLVLLPPLSMDEADQRFVLVDSHPRPNLISFGAQAPTQAYARIHSSLEDLVLALHQVLPITVLEDEMINILYNSFDLYVIQHDAA